MCATKDSSASIPSISRRSDRVKAGDVVDNAAISQQAQRMSALQDFDSVGYRLDGDRQSPDAHMVAARKELGTGLSEARISAHTPRVDGDLRFNLYGRHVRTWVNSLGAEWRNELQIGGEMLVATSLFQPLDAAHRFFVEPRALLFPVARGSFHR